MNEENLREFVDQYTKGVDLAASRNIHVSTKSLI